MFDEGVGIKPDELAHIFDPYYQASHTNTLRMTGTGIGLSLVKQFAERHAGTVQVASRVGAGTMFRLRLPFGQAHLRPADLLPDTENLDLQAPTPPLDAEALVQWAAPTALGTRPRLLVVEDNDEVNQYLQQLFRADFEMTSAADGLEGWVQALAQLPDLIISDVMMPVAAGAGDALPPAGEAN